MTGAVDGALRTTAPIDITPDVDGKRAAGTHWYNLTRWIYRRRAREASEQAAFAPSNRPAGLYAVAVHFGDSGGIHCRARHASIHAPDSWPGKLLLECCAGMATYSTSCCV